MSETSGTDSFADRLVSQRLVAPGVLHRGSLQRTHERLSNPAGAHVLTRLQRRATPAGTSAESLPLVRIDRSASSGDAPSTSFVASAIGPAANAGSTVARGTPTGGDTPAGSGTAAAGSRANGASGGSAAGGVVARQAPTISRAAEVVARRVADVPGLAAGARTTARLLARSQQSSDVPSATPPLIARVSAPGVVQRAAESRREAGAKSVGGTAAATLGASSAASAPPESMVLRNPLPTTSAHASRAGAPDASVTTSAAPRGSVAAVRASTPLTSAGPAAAPLLMRKAATTQHHGSGGLAVAVASPAVVRSASTQLLLRAPDASAPAVPPRTATPPVAGASAGGSAGATPRAAGPQSTARDSTWTHAGEANIEWIAEQVGNRLARRLEIERERMGVRQWRQVS